MMRQLFLLFCLLLLPVTGIAYDFEQDGIYYNINGNNAIVTSGESPYSGDVTLPGAVVSDGKSYPVTAIAHSAFRGCISLTSIAIPRSITAIDDYAFLGCAALSQVHITDLRAWCAIEFASPIANPCYYAHHLFLNGDEVIGLAIPDSVQAISAFAFYGCAALDTVSIPASVMAIWAMAFADCPSITCMTVAADNPVYDSRDSCNAIIRTETNKLIAGCMNTVIPGTVTSIADGAFHACTGLTSIHIPNSVTEIGLEAFYRCSSLMGVNIPNSVRVIGYQAFYGCSSLRGIHIPASVWGIGSSAFEFCPSLGSISVSPDNPRFDSRDECNAIIETDDNLLIAGCRNTVIPPTVTEIEDCAFSGCSALSSIEIPVGVTKLGEYAFRGCSALRSVVIPEGVTSIGASAFFDCTALNRVDIPASVVSIGGYAFEHCPALSAMNVAIGNPEYDSRDSCNAIIETATGTLMAGCMNTVIPMTVTAIGDNAFSGSFMLTKVNIPKSVTSIGDYAFTECTSLSTVSIPTSVTSIGEAAFSGCSALTTLNIPNSVTTIGQAAFSGCSSLESISLPKTVTVIKDYEFYGCTMLKDISIPGTVTSIGTAAFRGCVSLPGINIPKSVTSIGSSAFRDCPSLTSVTVARGNPVYDSREGCNAIIQTSTGTLIAGCQNTVIPSSVPTIGYAAFDGSVFLRSITIPNTVKTIARKAFNNCPGLVDVICHIGDPSLLTTAPDAFKLPSGDYTGRTLHVPTGSAAAYQSSADWSPYFQTVAEQ